MKNIINFSKILTILTSAGFVPIYISLGFSFFPSRFSPLDSVSSSLIGIAFLALIPMILSIRISHGKYNILNASQKDRNILYVVTLVNYLIATFLFWYLNANTMFVISLSYLIIGIMMAIINVFWKISAHTAGITGPVTALVYVYGLNLLPLYLLVFPVMFLRYKDKVHNISQLTVGAILAIIVTFLTYATFY